MVTYDGNKKLINGVDVGIQSCYRDGEEYNANIFIPVNSRLVYIRIAFTNDANWELPAKGLTQKNRVYAESFLRQNLAEIKAFIVELSKHS